MATSVAWDQLRVHKSVAGWVGGKGGCLVRTDCVSVCMCVAVLSSLSSTCPPYKLLPSARVH